MAVCFAVRQPSRCASSTSPQKNPAISRCRFRVTLMQKSTGRSEPLARIWSCVGLSSSRPHVPVDFCINVTLNRKREIAGFFCGDVLEAHREGCRIAKQTAMVRCDRAYPIVVTTNSGYPLDLNLYQAVKGMSAAAQIVEPGGLILAAARCK